MADIFDQDPQDWRRLRDVDHGMAPAFHEKAKNNPDYVGNFYSEKGYAAHAFLESLAKPYLKAREGGWTSVGDKHENRGDISHSTAGAVEGTDTEGGKSVRRTAPEA